MVRSETTIFVVWGLMVLFTGCQDNTPNIDIPPVPGPLLHTQPAWLDDDTLLFYSTGESVPNKSTSASSYPNVGIMLFNLITGETNMLVPNGNFPCGFGDNQRFAALSADHSGAIVLGTPIEWGPIGEELSWSFRISLTINKKGDSAAFRGSLESENYGIYLLDLNRSTARYVSQGEFPDFHPQEDKLLFQQYVESSKPVLVEYDLAQSHLDTVLVQDESDGFSHPVYSTSGDSIAFFRRSHSSDRIGICVLDLAEESVVQLDQSKNCFGLSWGKRGVVFTKFVGDAEDSGDGVLWLLDPETGESQQLTERF